MENLDPKGTGILFYEFLRIKTVLEKRKFIFWAFENVASMNVEHRDKITALVHILMKQNYQDFNVFKSHLGTILTKIDACVWSPHHRARFIWSNLIRISGDDIRGLKLQDVLSKRGNRMARANILNTVTTSSITATLGDSYLYFKNPWVGSCYPKISSEKVQSFLFFCNIRHFDYSTWFPLDMQPLETLNDHFDPF